MANKLLNFRCPEPLLEAIDKIGQEYYPADNDSGCDRSKTLIDILIAGVEALTNGDVVLQKPGTVTQNVRQVTEADIKAMVEALVTEKLTQLPVQNSVNTSVQIPPNIPTRNEFHDLKELINGYKISLTREIQNRDKSINLLAEQVAELTARLDAAPQYGEIPPEVLETAKEAVLRKWRVAKAPEKKERIEQALDKFIDIVSTPETNTNPQPKTQPEVARVPETKNKTNWKVGDKCSVKMPSGVIIWGVEIVSINKNGTCGILVRDTNTHFPADLADLIVPEPDNISNKKSDNKTDISPRTKRKPLTAWQEWEELCTDNIDDIWEQW